MKARLPKLARQPFYVHGLLCESIRPEASGTATLVGVFREGLFVDEFPGNLVNISGLAWICWAVGRPSPQNFTAILQTPDGTEHSSGPLLMPAIPPPTPDTLRHSIEIVVSYSMVPIVEPGTVRFIVEVDGRRYLASGLRIVRRPEAPTPPAAS